MEGQTIGKFRVISKLGKGGMGVVYLAEHTLIGQTVAIKVLLPRFSHNEAIVTRFFNEAKAAAAIKHPGIVSVLDFGYLPEGGAYLVMEHLQGQPLDERMRNGTRLPLELTLEFTRQIADTLQAAHTAGIVHRDLKPDNVFLVPDSAVDCGVRIKLLDFGIAKLMDNESGKRTRTGVIMGTPAYMAPEQCRGLSNIDHRADLYSLGCIMFQMLCGQPPFKSEAVGDILGGHMYFQPPVPSHFDANLPPSVETLILSLLAKKPDNRPGDATTLLRDIDRIRASIRPLAPNHSFSDAVAISAQPPSSSRSSQLPPGQSEQHVGTYEPAASAPGRTTMGQSTGERLPEHQTVIVNRPLTTSSLLIALAFILVGLGGYASWRQWSQSSDRPSVTGHPTPSVAATVQAPGVSSSSSSEEEPNEPTPDDDTAAIPAIKPPAIKPPATKPPAIKINRTKSRSRTANARSQPAKLEREPAPEVAGLDSEKKRSQAPAGSKSDRAGRLSKKQVDEGIAKVAKRIQSCGNLYQVRGTVSVMLSITPRGVVSRAEVLSAPSKDLGSCVKTLIKNQARFPITRMGIKTTYSVSF